jgi:hypothetical protein
MKVSVVKADWEWFKEMGDEARTRSLEVSTYRRFNDDREIELEIKEVKG